ncbi:MAG: hypothetical protein JW855_06065 [Gammaproteobacteria bacterium]|nr:hypothetical protein [Gammaproteobacteria bacterium]
MFFEQRGDKVSKNVRMTMDDFQDFIKQEGWRLTGFGIGERGHWAELRNDRGENMIVKLTESPCSKQLEEILINSMTPRP